MDDGLVAHAHRRMGAVRRSGRARHGLCGWSCVVSDAGGRVWKSDDVWERVCAQEAERVSGDYARLWSGQVGVATQHASGAIIDEPEGERAATMWGARAAEERVCASQRRTGVNST